MKNKKTIIITVCMIAVAAAVALVLGLTLGKSHDTTPDNGTSPVATDKAGDVSGNETDPVSSDGGSETAKPAVTDGNGGEATAEPGADSTAEPADTDDPETIDDDDDGQYVVDLPEPVVFVTEGEVEGGSDPWPADQIPSDVPAFKNIIKFYTCSLQQDDDIESWYMSWDAKKADFDAWMAEVTAAGFYPSSNVAYYYGNGNVIIDVETEENDDGTIWVSLDILRSGTTWIPDTISGIYPEFDTTASVWYTVDNDDSFDINYQCAKDWEGEFNAYIEKLYDAGFELSYGKAEKTVDGKTYVLTWGVEANDREILHFGYGK